MRRSALHAPWGNLSGESRRSEIPRLSTNRNRMTVRSLAAPTAICEPAFKRGQIMLVVEKLTHVYPNGVKALDDVSLMVPKGMFGLLGPNGAGKSTLMRSIATLQVPTSGSIRFGDTAEIDVIKEPEAIRRTLGYLPQDFGVYPRVSAYDMLDHMAVLKGIGNGRARKDTVESLLNQTNLWAVRNKALAGF